MWVQSLGEEEPLKKKTATHSSILNLICVVDAFGQPVVSMDHFSEFFFFFLVQIDVFNHTEKNR